MFKLEESSCETYGHVGSKGRGEDDRKKKGIALATKATPHSMEENKPNSSNRRKIEVTSSDSRTNSHNEKGSVNKGIHVLSSRQSSLERRPLATSHSR